jgi:hypothetical protein
VTRVRAKRPPAAAPPATAKPPHHVRAAWPWALAGTLAILPLLWASRGPTLGVPVADDYLFLSQLGGGRSLDLFGPMGAACYWRPVSRQLYFLLLGPWLVRAPWVAALLAVLLLLALYAVLYRLARHRFDAPVAAALASFPLLAEPARVLLAWPSAAQHLLGALFAALAIERTAAGSLFPAGAAALLALLSNEAAFLVLPALPLLAWFRTRSRRETARWGLAAALVAALWAAGYAVARAHGAGAPAGTGAGLSAPAYWAVLVQALASQLGWEAIHPVLGLPLLVVSCLLVAAGIAASLARGARRRIARAAPVLLGGLAWFLAGVAPLALLLPDWNAWRATVASLGLAFALTGWLALAWRPLAFALVALRLATLLLAHPGPATVSNQPPVGASGYSFARLVRLQRTVESTRTALLESSPRLRRHAVVRFWNLPQLAEVGFAGPRALRLWYGDSTLAWTGFGGRDGGAGRRDVLIEYDNGRPWPATIIRPQAMAFYLASGDSLRAGSGQAADSLLVRARRIQPGESLAFFGLIDLVRAQVALNGGADSRADSLLQSGLRFSGPSSRYWLLTSVLEQRRGDRSGAARALRECLALDPEDADALRLARALGLAPRP